MRHMPPPVYWTCVAVSGLAGLLSAIELVRARGLTGLGARKHKARHAGAALLFLAITALAFVPKRAGTLPLGPSLILAPIVLVACVLIVYSQISPPSDLGA